MSSVLWRSSLTSHYKNYRRAASTNRPTVPTFHWMNTSFLYFWHCGVDGVPYSSTYGHTVNQHSKSKVYDQFPTRAQFLLSRPAFFFLAPWSHMATEFFHSYTKGGIASYKGARNHPCLRMEGPVFINLHCLCRQWLATTTVTIEAWRLNPSCPLIVCSQNFHFGVSNLAALWLLQPVLTLWHHPVSLIFISKEPHLTMFRDLLLPQCSTKNEISKTVEAIFHLLWICMV
jgi:hypothetical protein